MDKNINGFMDELGKNDNVVLQMTEIYKDRFPTEEDRLYDGEVTPEYEYQLDLSEKENGNVLMIEP
jgi:hypothetical protein